MDKKYTTIFNAVTAAVESLEKTRYYLLAAQVQAEAIYMDDVDARTKILLERFRDYINDHKWFDVTVAKFGVMMTTLVSKNRKDVESRIFEGFEDLVRLMAQEMANDVADQGKYGKLTTGIYPQEVEETRQLLAPYFAGLDFEDECLEIMEDELSTYIEKA